MPKYLRDVSMDVEQIDGTHALEIQKGLRESGLSRIDSKDVQKAEVEVGKDAGGRGFTSYHIATTHANGKVEHIHAQNHDDGDWPGVVYKGLDGQVQKFQDPKTWPNAFGRVERAVNPKSGAHSTPSP
jgi:hypothetical protein